MKEYLLNLFKTLVIVAIGMSLLILSFNFFGLTGIIVTFAALIGLSIWHFNYSNKKEIENCPHKKIQD